MHIDFTYDLNTDEFSSEDARNYILRHPIIVDALSEPASSFTDSIAYIDKIVEMMEMYHGNIKCYRQAVSRHQRNVTISKRMTFVSSLIGICFFCLAAGVGGSTPMALLGGVSFSLISLYCSHIISIFAGTAHEDADRWNETLQTNEKLVMSLILQFSLNTNLEFMKTIIAQNNGQAKMPKRTLN